MLGGYQILDFKKFKFTSGQASQKTAHKLSIYDRIEATNKRTIVENLVVGDLEYDAMEIHFVPSQSAFVGTAYLGNGSIQIRITSTDTITITITQ